jgi:hypothetical protein
MFAKERLRIVVGGFLGLTPGGGVAWDYVQWPLGFAQLGHDVLYVEDTRLWPIYQEGAAVDCAPNVSRVRNVMAAFGLESRWAYRDEVSGECFGLSLGQLQEFCRSADLFVNISCSTFLRDEYRTIPLRALVDTDPMFTQIQYCNEVSFTSEKSGMREMFAGHTHYFTFGENIGQPDCRVPDCGVKWHSTRQPICLSHWDATPIPKESASAFTTLMNWTAARDLVFEGDTWGQKNVSLMRFLDLPQAIGGINLAVAVSQTSGTPFPSGLFRDHGWTVLSPDQCAPDWRSYRSFLSESFGEFSVAKQTYDKARTGWFSCRSACYLASGRPVVTQETGWSAYIPAGRGLLTFHDMEGARAALRAIVDSPEVHAKAARELAEEYFAIEKVLPAMLSDLGSTS